MTSLQAFLLGAVQGITEFLPVSSSTHVTILKQLLKIPSLEKTFDVFLNSGTLLAIVIFFRQQMIDLLLGMIDCISGKNTGNRSFFLTILLSSLPTLIIGAVLDIVFHYDAAPGTISFVCMILFSIILYFCDRNAASKKSISRKDSLLVGLIQPLALMPGVSRLGICLSAMRYLKYSREESFRHSMILSVPPVFGACILNLVKIVWEKQLIENWSLMVIGGFFAFILGLPTLFFIVRFLQNHTFLPIILYRILLGLTLIIVELLRVSKLL